MKIKIITVLLLIAALNCVSARMFKDSAMNVILKLREAEKPKFKVHHGMLGSLFSQVASMDKIEEKYFDQRLLHDGSTGDKTWKQRYFINPTFWKKPDGPVFFVFGGEGAISDKYVKDFAVREYAKELGALLVSLEHRFYGLSIPTTASTENLTKYLHSTIALQDVAYFAKTLNRNLGINGRWFAFGGSYPGSLAAWARLKHPDVFYGSISTSGPVKAVYDFYQYLDVVKASLEHYGTHTCSDSVQASFEVLEGILRSADESKHEELKKRFGICDSTDLSNHFDRYQLMTVIVGYFQGAAQYNLASQNLSLQHICGKMNDPTFDSAFDAFTELVKLFSKGECIDGSWDKSIETLRNESPKKEENMRQWTFQTCNEFGYYQTTDSKVPGIFGDLMPVSYSDEICKQAFGRDFDTPKKIEATNMFYGARDVMQKNILFVNGRIDPWHALSVIDKKNIHENQDFVVLEETSHCETMHGPSEDDTSELKLVRKLISKQLQIWLQQ